MIKAKDFWNFLCGTLGYRFFAGVPCFELNALYNEMSKEFMHYVPAVNEQIAVSLVNGAFLSGIKSAAIIHSSSIKKIDLSFNLENNIPLLIIAGGPGVEFNRNVHILNLEEDFKKSLITVVDQIQEENGVVVLRVKEGSIQ